MNIDDNVEAWIEIWRSVVYPFWRFFLRPLEIYFEYQPPDWMLNYVTIGLISAGMEFRKERAFIGQLDSAVDGDGFLPRVLKPKLLPILKSFLLWPIELFFAIRETLAILREDANKASKLNPVAKKVILDSNKVYWETGLWFLLLVATNYALLFKDGEFRWQQALLSNGLV